MAADIALSPVPLFRFANVDISVEGAQLKIRAATIDGSVDRPVCSDTVPATAASGVIYGGRRAGTQLDIEVTVGFAVIRAYF